MVIVCGLHDGGKPGCTVPIDLAFGADCDDSSGELPPRWQNWSRWHRLDPMRDGADQWVLSPAGPPLRLGSGPLIGLSESVHELSRRRGKHVRLPF
jgi:hypothetical protein